MLKPFAPAPPAGTKPGTLWGTEEYVRELIGDSVDGPAAPSSA